MFKQKNIIEFLKYLFIGAITFIIDFAILNVLWVITGKYTGDINYLFKFISFLACSIIGFFLNKQYIFKSHGSYIKYSSILGFFTIVDAIILTNLSKYNLLHISPILWNNISSLFAYMSTGFLQFLINKFIVFKHK